MERMKITTIGRGNIGGTLARLWTAAGHDVTELGRDGGDVGDAEVVLLAVPYGAAGDALAGVTGWGGQVIIDATNRLGGENPPDGYSLGRRVREGDYRRPRGKGLQPELRFAPRAGRARRGPAQNLWTGDESARAAVEQLTRDMGMEPVNGGRPGAGRNPGSVRLHADGDRQGRRRGPALLPLRRTRRLLSRAYPDRVGKRGSSSRFSDDELAAWQGLVRANAHLLRTLDADLQRSHQLPLTAYDVLIQLGLAPGRSLRMSALAEDVHMSHNGLTRVVARLEADGLITRTRDEQDRRVVHAALTPEGLSALRAANQAHLAGSASCSWTGSATSSCSSSARSGTRSIRRSSPAASPHQTVAAGPVRRAELVLEQLPGAGLRQRLVAHVDRARHLEAGQRSRGNARELASGPARGHDDRVHGLAPPLVGDAEDRHLVAPPDARTARPRPRPSTRSRRR